MCDNEHRHALICEVAHDGKHFAGELRVKRTRRLVEEDNLRVCRNSAGNGNALLLAAGKLRGVIIVTVGKSDLVERFFADLNGFRLVHFAGDDETLCDVLQRCFVQKQVVVLEHERRFAAQARNLFFGDLIEFKFFATKIKVPLSAFSRKFMQRRRVVLPEPDGPMMATTSPCSTSRSTPAQHMQLAEGFFNVQNLQHNSALLVSVRRELLFAKALHPSEHRGENEVYKADLKV